MAVLTQTYQISLKQLNHTNFRTFKFRHVPVFPYRWIEAESLFPLNVLWVLFFGATHFCAETILISLLWQKFWIWYSQLNWSRMKYNCKAVTNAVLIKIYGILSFSLSAIICVVSKQRHWFQPTFFVLQWHIICFQSKPIQTNPIQSNSTLYEIICFWKKTSEI